MFVSHFSHLAGVRLEITASVACQLGSFMNKGLSFSEIFLFLTGFNGEKER